MLPINKQLPAAVLPFLLLFSSCATILNQPLQKITIATANNIQLVSVDRAAFPENSLTAQTNEKIFYVERSNKPLAVHLQIDTAHKTVLLKPHNSPLFWLNIYFNYGIGMLVDLGSPKRFDYPSKNYFTVTDSLIHRQRFAPLQKGTANLSFSLPCTTIFSVRPLGKQYNSAGILGLETGFDYFYRGNRYVSINVGAATDRLPVDYFGPGYVQTTDAVYASARNNLLLGSFDLGYGISLSHLRWSRVPIDDSLIKTQSQKSTGLGFSFSVHYRLGKYFQAGILYQPTLLSVGINPTFGYQHFMSLNFTLKLPLKKANK